MAVLPLSIGLLCGGIFVLVFIILGIVLILGNARARKRAGESQSWPTTSARILLSEVRVSQTRDEDGNLQAPAFYPYVEYDYLVNGQTYQSKKLAFGSKEMFGNQAAAQAKLASYPVGAAVPIFYNPAKPGDAVLERVAPKSKTGMIVGIIFLVIGACGGLGLLASLILNLVQN